MEFSKPSFGIGPLQLPKIQDLCEPAPRVIKTDIHAAEAGLTDLRQQATTALDNELQELLKDHEALLNQLEAFKPVYPSASRLDQPRIVSSPASEQAFATLPDSRAALNNNIQNTLERINDWF